MRIGIDCRLWNETGVGRYIRNLVANLQKIDKKNNYVLFVLPKDEEKIKLEIRNLKFEIVPVDIYWHTLEEQIRFPQIIASENLDLMHFPYFSIPIFYNKPFVITVHDLIKHHFSTGRSSTLPLPVYWLKLYAYKFILSRALRKAKKIIAVSYATKDEIVNLLEINPKKIIITYEGTDSAIQNSEFRIQNLVKGKYFLYVGNAFPHKNLERLLEAFKNLISKSPDWQKISLVFVGKEDYFYKKLQKRVRQMNLSNNTIFLQNITDQELSGLYKNAIALVFPSLMEGFGLPALEAMANKCLVLASDIPSLKEICRDAALYFDPYNSSDIESKLEMLLLSDMNNFSDKIQKGEKRASTFSFEKMAKETLEIYESCVGVRQDK